MPKKVFTTSKYKPEIMDKLRSGVTKEELLKAYPEHLHKSIRRYEKEVDAEKKGQPNPTKKIAQVGNVPSRLVAEGVSHDAFTPQGTPVPPPPGSNNQDAKEFLTIGTFRMPMEDWGYSSALNLLIVAETYDQLCTEYGFDRKRMKVGDVMAHLCQAFRMMQGWDIVGGGYIAPKKIEGDGNGCRN